MNMSDNRKYIPKEEFIKQVRIKKMRQKYQQISDQQLQSKKIRINYDELIKEKTIYRILNSLSSRICEKLKELNIKRTFRYKDVLGCSIEEFENHLKNLMKEGMSFDNYGKWQVDHIIPFSYFDFNNPDDIKSCCNFKNLQPLWKPENREKSYKLPESLLITKSAQQCEAPPKYI